MIKKQTSVVRGNKKVLWIIHPTWCSESHTSHLPFNTLIVLFSSNFTLCLFQTPNFFGWGSKSLVLIGGSKLWDFQVSFFSWIWVKTLIFSTLSIHFRYDRTRRSFSYLRLPPSAPFWLYSTTRDERLQLQGICHSKGADVVNDSHTIVLKPCAGAHPTPQSEM